MIQRLFITATRLRLILVTTLLAMATVAVVTIHFLHEGLDTFAIEVSHATADAKASEDNIQKLQKVQQELTTNKAIIERTNNIVADSKSYQYQNQIITDLNQYAAKAGIGITNIDFTSTTPSLATPGAPSGPIPTGVKSTSVSITIDNPVIYNNLLNFIHSIEQNLTKMQISRIGLAKGAGSDVTSEVLTIEVYIR
jgi:TolA-binding protein